MFTERRVSTHIFLYTSTRRRPCEFPGMLSPHHIHNQVHNTHTYTNVICRLITIPIRFTTALYKLYSTWLIPYNLCYRIQHDWYCTVQLRLSSSTWVIQLTLSYSTRLIPYNLGYHIQLDSYSTIYVIVFNLTYTIQYSLGYRIQLELNSTNSTYTIQYL